MAACAQSVLGVPSVTPDPAPLCPCPQPLQQLWNSLLGCSCWETPRPLRIPTLPGCRCHDFLGIIFSLVSLWLLIQISLFLVSGIFPKWNSCLTASQVILVFPLSSQVGGVMDQTNSCRSNLEGADLRHRDGSLSLRDLIHPNLIFHVYPAEMHRKIVQKKNP